MGVDTVKSAPIKAGEQETTMDEEQADLHPLTKLMLARMESHPEEFDLDGPNTVLGHPDRWRRALKAIRDHAPQRDRELVRDKLDVILLQRAHEWAMDELLNGDERRERENNLGILLAQQQTMVQQAMAQQVKLDATGLKQASNQSGAVQSARWDPTNDTFDFTAPKPSLLRHIRRGFTI